MSLIDSISNPTFLLPNKIAANPFECETEILLGDVNFDEQVDVLDIVILVSFILMTDSPTDVESIAGDYNGDGDINVMDIIIIIEYILN